MPVLDPPDSDSKQKQPAPVYLRGRVELICPNYEEKLLGSREEGAMIAIQNFDIAC